MAEEENLSIAGRARVEEELTASLNCNRCYSKKIKCDRSLPSCSECNQAGSECEYQRTSRFQKICAPCRAAKKKCSKDVPTCSRCQHMGLPCSYPSEASGYTKKKKRPRPTEENQEETPSQQKHGPWTITSAVNDHVGQDQLLAEPSQHHMMPASLLLGPTTGASDVTVASNSFIDPPPSNSAAVESFFYNLGVAIRQTLVEGSDQTAAPAILAQTLGVAQALGGGGFPLPSTEQLEQVQQHPPQSPPHSLTSSNDQKGKTQH